MAGTLQRRLGVGDALAGIDEPGSLRLGVERGVLEQRIGQRLEPRLARDLRLGAALRLEGRVEVFQLDLGRRAVDRAASSGVSLPCSSMLFSTVARRSSSSRR